MLISCHFSLDNVIPPQNCALSGMVAGDRANVVAVCADFDPDDEITQAAFTAKVAATDADNAPTTVQLILASGDGVVDVDALRTIREITFELSPTVTEGLTIAHVYDIRLWVERAGQSYDRLIQRGSITVQTL